MPDDLNPEVEVQTGTPAMTVNVSTEPEDNGVGDGGDDLLAGKFKTQEDLVNAYKALESKLGQQQPQQQTAEDTTTGTDPDDEGNQTTGEDGAGEDGTDGDDPYAIYGETVGAALKSAEVDPKEAAAEFEETGTLSDEKFDQFEKAGFPREMVEAYLRGAAASRESQAEDINAQIEQAKAIAGGDEGYAQLQTWMAQNMDQAAIEAFNAEVASGDLARIQIAIQKAAAARTADMGTEGKLRTGQAAAEGVYASEAEYLEDMAKPEYKASQAFRDRVATKLMRSPTVFSTR